MISIDTLLFDLDGTLVNSAKDIVKTVNLTLKKLQLPEKSGQEIISYVGKGIRHLMINAVGQKNSSCLKESIELYQKYYLEISAKESVLFPNVRETLEYFQNKTIFIVTNRTKEASERLLKITGIDHYFKEVLGGDDENCRKPSACPINRVLSKVPHHKSSIMIGDMDIDVLAGKEAGIFTCAVTYGIGEKEAIEKARPDFIIADLIQLKNIIC